MLSFKSRAIPIESSMYISTFPISFIGGLTASCFAGWNLISAAKGNGSSKDKDKLSCSDEGSQNSLWMIVLLISANVSEMYPYMDGQGVPPKVMRSAISRILSKIVRLSEAVEPDKWHHL